MTTCLSKEQIRVYLKVLCITSIMIASAGCSTTPIFFSNFDHDTLNTLPGPNPPGLPNKDLFRIGAQDLLRVVVWNSQTMPSSQNPQNHAFEITHGVRMSNKLLVPAPQFLAFPQNTYEVGAYTQGRFEVTVLGYVPVGNYNANDEFFILLSKNNDVQEMTGTWISGGIKGKGGELYAISGNGEQPLGVSYASGEEIVFSMLLDLDQSTVSLGASNLGSSPIHGERLDDLPMMGTSKSFSALAFGLLRPAATGPGLPGKFVVDTIRIGTAKDNIQPD